MKGFVTVFRVMLCMAASLLLTCCEHKELCYDHSHSVEIEIRFNWQNAPDATPRTMVVNFFSTDGRHVAVREFTSMHGGKIKMDAGEYRILCHNGEMENVKEAVDAFDRYSLITAEESLLAPMSRQMDAPPRPSVSADEPVRTPAETVWAGQHEYVNIERGRNGQVIELFPEEVSARYTVEIVNVENLKDNLGISAALTGLSERLNISGATGAGQPVTVPFTIDRKDPNTLEARFVTFGHCPEDNSVAHILSVYTSKKVYYNYDVTDQVHAAPDPRNVYIRIDGIKLPTEGDTMTPSILSLIHISEPTRH